MYMIGIAGSSGGAIRSQFAVILTVAKNLALLAQVRVREDVVLSAFKPVQDSSSLLLLRMTALYFLILTNTNPGRGGDVFPLKLTA